MQKKIGLFFGTDTGNTERIADLIMCELGENSVDLHDIAEVKSEDFEPYKFLILGQPTWYYGELQSHWEDFWETFEKIDFSNKIVALFGLGDQYDYAEYFLDAIGMMDDIVTNNGGEVIGKWSTDSYEFIASKAVDKHNPNQLVGLGIDEDQQPELTNDRISKWVALIKPKFKV